jgi:hypothetical protein
MTMKPQEFIEKYQMHDSLLKGYEIGRAHV